MLLYPLLAALALQASQEAPPAQPKCGPRDDVLKVFEEKFNERPAHVALSSQGVMIEVLVSPGGDTWTMIMTDPSKTSCVVDAGQHWVDVKQKGVDL